MTTVARSRANRATQRETAVRLFHALSDETRLAVIDMLRGGERCVCDLQGTLDAAQSRLSFHLKVLKDAGLVTDRREGRWSYYSLNPDRVDQAIASLRDLTTPTVERGLSLHSIQRVAKPVARAKQSNSNGCC
jgi:ArsR family transcriptional regulator